jgi:hypothetical protein
MSPAQEFDRPITQADLDARLSEAVAQATAKRGRAPLRASASIVDGNKIRCVVEFTTLG